MHNIPSASAIGIDNVPLPQPVAPWDNCGSWRNVLSHRPFFRYLRGHLKSSQKLRETNKSIFTKKPIPPPKNNNLHFRLQLSDQCVQNDHFEAGSVIFANPSPQSNFVHFTGILRTLHGTLKRQTHKQTIGCIWVLDPSWNELQVQNVSSSNLLCGAERELLFLQTGRHAERDREIERQREREGDE